MSKNKWIGFLDEAEQNSIPKIDVQKSKKQLVSNGMRDMGERTVITVQYTTYGAWEGTVKKFTKIDVPETTNVEMEGAPSVPKDGIFVAVPMDAEDVEVCVADKSFYTLPEDISLVPAPKQFIEEEFREVYEPNPEIYDSDDQFPGRDFDYLGLKTIGGVKVAHILVYLGQYRPVSKKMDVVQSMTLEVSFVTPPAKDRSPGRKARDLPEEDLILGLDLLDEGTDYSSKIEDFDNLDQEFVDGNGHESGNGNENSPFDLRGISFLDQIEDTGYDSPVAITPTPTAVLPTIHPGAMVAVLPRIKLKVSGLIAEFVIITPHSLRSAVAPLLAAKTGWPFYGMVAETEDIAAEFPNVDLKESIKSFIVWASDHWRVPPRFVVLAGDTDTIPIHIYDRGGNSYASDHYYSDIGGDLVPEITVSRIPTSNAVQMETVCEHLVEYEDLRGGDWGGWQNRVMLCAYQSSTYESTCDAIHNKIKSRFTSIKRYAKNTTKNDVVDTLNDGVVIALYRGHGSKTAWQSSNGINSNDVANLANGSHPPFVLNICCQNGWVDDNNLETITEAFIRKEKSVAVFSSSRNSWTYPNNDFAKYMFDAIMSGKCHTPAAIIRYAKTKMVQNHGTSNAHLDNTVMYNLFGDPTADVASNSEWLRGEWSMDHDGWRGTLKITRIWNYHIESNGSYTAPVWNISGQYLSQSNETFDFSGKLGGFDSNQLGSGSKRSDHKVEITIKFSASNQQKFIGYVHTWSLSNLSGLTWWSNHPFGWTAQKIPE